MTQAELQMRAEAIEWRLRLRDSGDDSGDGDWERFVRWLEGDPARSAAYDMVALLDMDLDGVPIASPSIQAGSIQAGSIQGRSFLGNPAAAGPGPAPARRRWIVPFAAAAAAALVLMVMVPRPGGGSSLQAFVTAPGEHKLVALADGGSVAMNGDSRLILDRANPRSARLAAGEALFTIRHDAAHPFEVTAGGHVIRDAGTAFNLSRDGGMLSVEIVSGRVVYDPGRTAIALAGGDTLTLRGPGAPVVARADPAKMAGWRSGQLSYSAAPLGKVARDLSRTTGAAIGIDPSLAPMPFTGSIRIAADRAATVNGLAAALGLEARRTGAGWTIEPRPRARR